MVRAARLQRAGRGFKSLSAHQKNYLFRAYKSESRGCSENALKSLRRASIARGDSRELCFGGEIRQSRRDCLVAIGGGVLVDERGARAGMTHPRHELSGARTGGCGKGVAGMAEIMKMEMSQAGRVASPVP